jgi:hypothetical protein
MLCIFLGTGLPAVLRKNTTDSTFQIIGHSYLHRFMDGEALVGPLPKPWIAKREVGPFGTWQPRFYNSDTLKAVGLEADPRLGPVSDDWENLENDDPHRIQKWKNKGTGETINSDPRLLPQALIKRGVKLQTFALT